eukprot:jgi/Tetstr1/454316/TSEL_041235.t1
MSVNPSAGRSARDLRQDTGVASRLAGGGRCGRSRGIAPRPAPPHSHNNAEPRRHLFSGVVHRFVDVDTAALGDTVRHRALEGAVRALGGIAGKFLSSCVSNMMLVSQRSAGLCRQAWQCGAKRWGTTEIAPRLPHNQVQDNQAKELKRMIAADKIARAEKRKRARH